MSCVTILGQCINEGHMFLDFVCQETQIAGGNEE